VRLTRREIVLLAAVGVATLLLAVVPWVSTPLSRVANYDGDGPDPLYDAAVDAGAIRRAGRLLPDDTTYFLHAPSARPLLAGNLKAAGQLFLAPALPVRDPRNARWVLSYGPGRLLPPGVQAEHVYRLGGDVALVEIRR
jgi:hypothetical protein